MTKSLVKLSPKEVEILELIAQGKTDKEIASQEKCALSTIKNHLLNIRIKLNADSRTHAIAIAITKGLIRLRS